MIQLKLQGMLGNNLFQYVFGRILAEKTGFAMESIHSDYSPEKNVPELLDLMGQFADAPLNLPGRKYEGPVDRTAWFEEGGEFDGFRVDVDRLARPDAPRRILLKGFFERYEYIRPYKERVRQWFRIDPVTLGHEVQDADVVIHLRRGDFIVFGRAISLDYYRDVLESLPFRRLYVCGYGFDREARKVLAPFDPVYVQGSPVSDFRFMKGFRRMVLSQSTFSWWAGFLSDADAIYAPLTIPGSNEFERAFPHIDLEVDDEDRYHYVRDVPYREGDPGISHILSSWKHLSRWDRYYFLTQKPRRLKNRLLSRLREK